MGSRGVLFAFICIVYIEEIKCSVQAISFNSSDIFIDSEYKHEILPEPILQISRRVKKGLHLPSFNALRIHIEYIGSSKSELGIDELERLLGIVKTSARHLAEIFSVTSDDSVLLLPRAADLCGSTWLSGPNAGRCALLRANYKGEFCMDNFQIPDKHLEGFYIWNATHPAPVSKIQPGEGIQSDFILYLRSWTGPNCVSQGRNIMAYASHCRQDNTGRPFAGYMNICPFVLHNSSYSDSQLRALVTHELLHALGFSSDLFSLIRNCSLVGDTVPCVSKPFAVVSDSNGAKRLLSPKIQQLSRQHFACNNISDSAQFGPILQLENGEITSHWDSAFMYSSIMTPQVGQLEESVLDPITLAYFEDAGWYKVNYDLAGNFIWGQGGGCNFALLRNLSENGNYFCPVSDEKACHHLHRSKGICSSNTYLRGFRVLKPEKSCLIQNAHSSAGSHSAFELFGSSSRCFMSSINITLLGEPASRPVCYRHRCTVDLVVQVFIRDEWWTCPHDQQLQIPGLVGVITCPRRGVLCTAPKISQQPLTVQLSSTVQSVIVTVSSAVSSIPCTLVLLLCSIVCTVSSVQA